VNNLEMTEVQLYESIRTLARMLGLRLYHTHDSRRSYSGFPDVVVLGTGGLLFRELKRDGTGLKPEQRLWLDALVEAGADAGVWRPADWHSGRITTELGQLRRVKVSTR
jgi:hypothetical protein